MAFKLSDAFMAKYEGKQPNWGFGALSYFTYKRTYSRMMENGRQEEFVDTLKRVTEGTFRVQEEHCKRNGLPWNAHRAQRTAQEFFERMWEFKFSPPGRGLWIMGTSLVDKIGSAALNNCGFVSTKDINIELASPFAWAMDMLMLGVGIGFDVRGAGSVTIKEPRKNILKYVVPDTREGWVESVRLLINAYHTGNYDVEFDYTEIRPFGAPINGFGGKASGPAPLQELHANIRRLLNALIGHTITSVAITDVMNFVGKCVVAGNVRRSAEIAIGNIDDADYVKMKDYNLYPEELDSHRWASNNSVFAKPDSDFSGLVENIALNGEPGLIFLDNARHYGRYKDGWISFEDDRFDDVHGFNPCVTSDTWIHTSKGPRQVCDLVDVPFKARVDGKDYDVESNGFWKTGTKRVHTLITTEGFELRLTGDHKVLVDNGSEHVWKSAQGLSFGDRIVINNHRKKIDWSKSGVSKQERDEGYILGLLVGDGTFVANQPVLSVWSQNNPGYEGIMKRVKEASVGLRKRSDFKGWNYIADRSEYRFKLSALRDITQKYDIDKTKEISKKIEKGSREFYQGFLRGFFDADGSVQGTQRKGISVRLSQSDKKRLQAVQRMLLRLGIYSKIYTRRKEGWAELPDGQGGNKSYFCKQLYELIIAGEDVVEYSNLIGFSDTYKSNLLLKKIAAYKRSPNKTKFVATFVELIEDGFEDVYDVTVADVHAFDANGLYVHNCSEQQLENNELCTLVETFPANHDTVEDYHKTLKFAYLYAKTITLIPTHDERTNAVMMRNRRIGCSMSGIQQALQKFGHREFLTEFCDKGYSVIRQWDRVYSRWLGIPRSIKMTTVKPSGTVSILAGATPGVHFTHSEYYFRTVRCSAASPLIVPLLKAGYKVEYAVNEHDKMGRALKNIGWYDDLRSTGFKNSKAMLLHFREASFKEEDFPLFEAFAAEGGTVVVYFPVKERNFTKSKFDATIWEQLNVVREMQYYWSDNAVSCTVSVQEDERKDLEIAIKYFAPYVKTLSFLPLTNHQYQQAPYQECGEEEYSSYAQGLKKLDFTAAAEAKISGSKFCDGDSCEI